MKTTTLSILAATMAAMTFIPGARAEDDLLECSKFATFLAPADSPEPRRYAVDKEFQAIHVTLDVRPDFKQRTIESKATLRFKPVLKPSRELKLDAVDLDVQSVNSSEKIQGYQVTSDKLIITFVEPLTPDKEYEVAIGYKAQPTAGIYFRTPEMGYKEGDTHLFTQGEEIEARHWYPCLDSPNQRLTTEITCTVPKGMTVISNGRLVSKTEDPASGMQVFHWSQEKPHANYLVSLVAGYFNKLEDKCGEVPLCFYTLPSQSAEAMSVFGDTKEIMEFLQKEIGVAYPWDKYDQTCVNDFVAGGMENTSATTLTDFALHTPATETLHNEQGLVSHEMAHQWFGDLVTCKDWSHIWLNEGFATYYETIFNGYKNGKDSMLYSLYERSRQITGMPNETNPIVRRNYAEARDMFGYLVYPKAAWIIRTLRASLGDDLFHRSIKTYLERHQYGNVVTEDLRSVIEELSGRPYDQFFDQFLYHGHFPELQVSYSWDETAKLAKLSIRQTQELGPNVILFNIPLTVRFKNKSGSEERTIQVSKREEDFYLSLPAPPEVVRIDPGYVYLSKISFSPSNPMLNAQMADQGDVIGRLLAVEQFSNRRDHESIGRLKDALNKDSFYGVRMEAARALRSIHNEETLDALLDSTTQSDARVRQQVVEAIGSFYSDKAFGATEKVVEGEHNPEILSVALRGLGAYEKPAVHETTLKYLNEKSFRNELAVAAIASMRAQDNPVYVKPLLEHLREHAPDFASRGLGQSLDTLAYLARNEENKDEVREFLLTHLQDKKRSVQIASINALGTLGDPKASAAVERFVSAAKDSPERSAAERVLPTLRASRKPVDDFKNLRQEVLDLQKANRELRHDLDDLKKKTEARVNVSTETPPADAKPKKNKKGSKKDK